MTASGCFRLARGGGPGGLLEVLFPHVYSRTHSRPTATHDLANHCKWWCIIQTGSVSSVLERRVFKSDSHNTVWHSRLCLCSALTKAPQLCCSVNPPPLLFMLLYIHFHYSNNCFWIRKFAIAKGKIIITIMKFILRTRSSKLHVGHRIKEYQCLNPHQALLWSTLLSSLPHTVCHTQKLPVHWALKGAWLSWGQPRPLHTSKGY